MSLTAKRSSMQRVNTVSYTHLDVYKRQTVGDPFKDTSGPSINILIKLMTIVAVVFAPLFVQIGGLL